MTSARAGYTIEAAVYSLGQMGRPYFFLQGVGHCFWALYQDGKAVRYLHGFAAARNADGTPGKRLAVGGWNDLLQVYLILPGEPFCLPITESRIAYESEDALARWERAERQIPWLNAQRVRYSAFGINCGNPINSNSAYRTFGECMGLEVRGFEGYWTPGLQNPMVHPRRLDDTRLLASLQTALRPSPLRESETEDETVSEGSSLRFRRPGVG